MPGSNLISTESLVEGWRLSFSVAQLNGGSMSRFIEVGRGPVFVISSVFEMGIEGTPFSHKYLKNSLASAGENCNWGVMKSPWMFVL